MTLPVIGHLDYEKIAYEVAVNHCGPKLAADILIMELGISAQQFAMLVDDQLFQRLVKGYVKELTENGTSFRLKARVLAEDILGHQYNLARDKDTPAAVSEKISSNIVRWAGWEQKPGDTAGADSNANKISISINLGEARPTVTIDATPQPVAPAIEVQPQGEVSEHQPT